DQLGIFHEKTGKAIENLSALSRHFDAHGKALVDAAAVVEHANRSTTASVNERKTTLESLVTTIDLRTADLDQRLSRFTGLLDESLAAAEERARDIARVVAETAGAGSAAISRQFEAVRAASEQEHQQTVDAMHDIYRQTTDEADAMFKQSAEKFANLVGSMKQMAGEMQAELEATRTELRRGVLEMPQEAAESTSQMRKVIVDQIEALAELNRIAAQHGRGLDVVAAGASRTGTATVRQEVRQEARQDARQDVRREEPIAVAGGSRTEPPRMREQTGSASNLPRPDLGMQQPSPRRVEAPPMGSPAD